LTRTATFAQSKNDVIISMIIITIAYYYLYNQTVIYMSTAYNYDLIYHQSKQFCINCKEVVDMILKKLIFLII